MPFVFKEDKIIFPCQLEFFTLYRLLLCILCEGEHRYSLSLRKIKIANAKMKAFGLVAFNSSGKRKLRTVKALSLSEAKRKIQQRRFSLASIIIRLWLEPFLIFKDLKEFFFSG